MVLMLDIIFADMSLRLPDMRLECVDIDRIYAGVCVCVQFGSTTRRMKNKPHADIVEWDDEVTLWVLLAPLYLVHTYDSKAD